MEKMNIIDILRDCPEGTKLYSLVHGEVELTRVGVEDIYCKPSYLNHELSFNSDGRWVKNQGECILFPSKENRNWNTFKRPFKDGDIIYHQGVKATAIFYKQTNDHTISHCFLNILGELKIHHYHCKSLLDWRFASEEEKQELFKVIKDNGYKWNPEAKTLEKLPKFKDGDILFVKAAYPWILIYKDSENKEDIYKYVAISTNPNHKYIVYDKNPLCCKEDVSEIRLASAEETKRLFKTIEDNGYCWDPKTKTLNPKFKDGDVVFYSNTIAIFKEWGDETLFRTYCTFYTTVSNPAYQFEISRPLNGKGIRRETRFATLEEKEKLFEVIRDNGYRWNPETKTLNPEFKGGDIVVAGDDDAFQMFILKEVKVYQNDGYDGVCYFGWDFDDNTLFSKGFWGFNRLASEEEKERLFKTLNDNGYEWDPQTKTLKKLPKFKVGDVIQDIDTYKVKITEVNIEDECYGYESIIAKGIGSIDFSEQDNWEMALNVPTFKVGDRIKHKSSGVYCTLGEYSEGISAYRTNIGLSITYKDLEQWDLYPLPDKFDINTLVPFESRVLVRDVDHNEWEGAIFGRYDGKAFFTIGGLDWRYCIPYEGNEHLLGKTIDCDGFYKNWE